MDNKQKTFIVSAIGAVSCLVVVVMGVCVTKLVSTVLASKE